MVLHNNSAIELMSTKKAAKYLDVSAGTLNNWRSDKSVQIPYIKLGGSVRYKKESLDAFIESQERL